MAKFRGSVSAKDEFGFSVDRSDVPALRASPFGYQPRETVATMQARYSAETIAAYVREHVHIPKDDAFAQVHSDILLSAYADYISKLPPHRQILLLDGDRPTGDMRYIAFGESAGIKGRDIAGVYDYYADSLSIRTQEYEEKPDDSVMPKMRPLRAIKNTIAHETGHQQDTQLPESAGKHNAWSTASATWEAAIQQEIAAGNTGQLLQDVIPDTKIRLHKPYFQYPPEAKAEFEMLFDNVYETMKGDFEAACACMNTAYPYMWPVFRDEYLAKTMEVAATLNPHIDMTLAPVGFDGEASPIPALNMSEQNRVWLWQAEKLDRKANALERLDKNRGEWRAGLQKALDRDEIGISTRLETGINEVLKDARCIPAGGLSCRVAIWFGADPMQAKTLADKIDALLRNLPPLDTQEDLDAQYKRFQSSEDAELAAHGLHDTIYAGHVRLALAQMLGPVARRLKSHAKAQAAVDQAIHAAIEGIDALAPQARERLDQIKRHLGEILSPQSREELKRSVADLRGEAGGQAHAVLQDRLNGIAARLSQAHAPPAAFVPA